MGLITPLGIGIENSWEALCAGKSGIAEITRFDASPHQTKIAAEVKDFNAEDFIPKKEVKKRPGETNFLSRMRWLQHVWRWNMPVWKLTTATQTGSELLRVAV
jgi:3-oxoacyl-(acyl-carrier-protein) synthase